MGAMKRLYTDIQQDTEGEKSVERIFEQFTADVVAEHDARHARDMEVHQALMAQREAKRAKPQPSIADKESDHYSVDF